MWTYSQPTGELNHDGVFVGTGYSGTGVGRNNPAMQDVPNVGPIPQGVYSIGTERADPRLGPCIMPLSPASVTAAFGRSGFFIHGNNRADNASHGCIILGPAIRQQIASSPDRDLSVTA